MPHMIVTDDQARSQFDETFAVREVPALNLRRASLKIAAIVQEVTGVCPDMAVDELLSLTGHRHRRARHRPPAARAARRSLKFTGCAGWSMHVLAAVEAQRNHRARGEAAPLVSDGFVALYNKHSEAIRARIDQTRGDATTLACGHWCEAIFCAASPG